MTQALRCWMVAAAAALAACGGGSDTTGRAEAPASSQSASVESWQPGATPVSGNYVFLQSESGDGQTRTYTYTPGDASIVVRSSGAYVLVHADGKERWWGEFQMPGGVGTLRAGTYSNLAPYEAALSAGGVRWIDEGRGCGTISSASFIVDHVAYAEGELSALDIRFEQRCERGAALRGKIHWSAAQAVVSPVPIAVPPSLWRPLAGATPATGSYVYLESDAGDRVGAGTDRVYTAAGAMLGIWAEPGKLTVRARGDASWGGYFQAMDGIAELRPGYYAALQRYLSHDPRNGGLYWSRNGVDCASSIGWFAVDSVSYAGGELSAIELRFEQRCDGAAGSLRGMIRWSAADASP